VFSHEIEEIGWDQPEDEEEGSISTKTGKHYAPDEVSEEGCSEVEDTDNEPSEVDDNESSGIDSDYSDEKKKVKRLKTEDTEDENEVTESENNSALKKPKTEDTEDEDSDNFFD
jgi:hypothetical protein